MRIYNYLIIVCLMAVSVALCGCSATDSPMPVPEGDVRLSLTIAVDEVASSRAPSGDYDPGSGYENYIGVAQGDFAVYLLDEIANTVLSQIDQMYLTEVATGNHKNYRLDFVLDRSLYGRLQGKSVKVLFLANWRIYPRVPTGATLDAIVRDAASEMLFEPFGAALTADTRIPMYGICRYDNLVLDPDKTCDLGTLHLLRAYAKTEIIDGGDKTSEHKIASVSLIGYNNRAAKAPYDVYDESDYVKGNWDDDYGVAPSIPASTIVVDTPTGFDAVGDNSFVIYCPEFKNEGVTADKRARMLVTYTDGQQYYVDYKDYDTGAPFDIRRNYYYKFTVTRRQHTVTVEADVLPYFSVSLEPPFGIEPKEP